MADEQKQQEIINRLKELAIELGKTPTIDEVKKVISKYQITVHFGGYTQLVQASGLDPVINSRVKKITNNVFNRDIEDHLSQHEDKTIIKRIPYEKIACLGDIHEPFSHANLKQDFKLFVSKFKPQYIFQMGDAFDMFSAGRFPRSHNIFTPKEEEKSARKNLEEFWAEMKKASPDSKLIQLVGNHDVRPIKRVLESLPTLEHWAEKYFLELLTFDHVTTVIDPREEFIINDIAFHHGYRSKLGDHRDYMHMNFVGGHTHRGGVVFRNIKNKVLWELNCGLAGDPTSKGLSYTNQKMNDWTLGWGAIDEYGPRFIPY